MVCDAQYAQGAQPKILTMAHFIFNSKKRGKKGEGRKVEFEHILVPKDFAEDLKLFKDIYSVFSAEKKDEFGSPIPKRISWEQLFRHWMELVKDGEPDVWDEYCSCKETRRQFPQTFPVDVTEGPVWEMKHIFYRDGDELDAVPEGDSFIAYEDGTRKTLEELLSDDWILMNEAGAEIPMSKIAELSRILQKQRI